MKADLATGKKGEKLVIALFEKNGHLIKFNEDFSKRSYHDLEFTLIDNNYHTVKDGSIEVKNDVYAAKSGNIAIEYFNSKSTKASGVMVSKADLWIHLAFGQIWVASLSSLKKFLKKAEPCRLIYSGGDGNADLMLFKADRLFDNKLFYQIDHLDKEQFTKTVLHLLK